MARPTRESEEGAVERPMGPEIHVAPEAAAADDVLLFNARAGVYQGYVSQADPAHSSERQQRINTRTLTLLPGLNFAPKALFETLAGQPGMAKRLEAGEILEVADLGALSSPRATAMVKATTSVDTLRRLQERKLPPDILDVIAAQIRNAEQPDDPANRVIGRRASA